MRYFNLNPLILTSSLALLAGCAGSSPSAQFYLLEPIAAQEVVDKTAKTSVLLSPVRIPHYLDRAQIVVAAGENRYQLSEFDRWAEGLDYNIQRVLQQNLSRLLPVDVASSVPNAASAIKIAVNLLEFHVDAQGQAKLTAQWQLTRDQKILLNHQQSYIQASAQQSYPAMVAALNDCLNQLSRDVAEGLRTILD